MTPERATEVLNLGSDKYGMFGRGVYARRYMTGGEIHFANQVWETMSGRSSFTDAIKLIEKGKAPNLASF